MRVSAVGWFFDTLEETERVAEISASITHNHPEGIKGAQATAAAIFLARTGTDYRKIGEDRQDFPRMLLRQCRGVRLLSGKVRESCQSEIHHRQRAGDHQQEKERNQRRSMTANA